MIQTNHKKPIHHKVLTIWIKCRLILNVGSLGDRWLNAVKCHATCINSIINLIEKTINLTIRKLDFHGKMFGNLQNFDIEIAKSMAIHFEAIISS